MLVFKLTPFDFEGNELSKKWHFSFDGHKICFVSMDYVCGLKVPFFKILSSLMLVTFPKYVIFVAISSF